MNTLTTMKETDSLNSITQRARSLDGNKDELTNF